MAGDFEIKKDEKGDWLWTLQATNNKGLARSPETFRTREECLHAIREVKAVATTALVFDMTQATRTMVEEGEVK